MTHFNFKTLHGNSIRNGQIDVAINYGCVSRRNKKDEQQAAGRVSRMSCTLRVQHITTVGTLLLALVALHRHVARVRRQVHVLSSIADFFLPQLLFLGFLALARLLLRHCDDVSVKVI